MLWVKALYLLFTAIAIVVVEKAMKQHSGGGDIKLYLALSFALGPFSLALLLMLTLIFHSAYQAVMTHRNKATGKDARFPLACFLFPSYLIYFSFLLISR